MSGVLQLRVKCRWCGKRGTFHVQRTLDGENAYTTTSRCVARIAQLCEVSQLDLARVLAKA